LTRLQPAFSAPASSWPPMMDTGGGGGERAAFIVKVYGLLFTMLGITAAVALLITRSLRVPTLRDVLGLFGGAGVLGSLTASIRMPRRQRRLAAIPGSPREPAEGATCRICQEGATGAGACAGRRCPRSSAGEQHASAALDDFEELQRFCACRGSLAFVHRGCLERWRALRGGDRCELCGAAYSVEEEEAPSAANARRTFVVGSVCTVFLVWAWLACTKSCKGRMGHLYEMVTHCTLDSSLFGWLRSAAGAATIGVLVDTLLVMGGAAISRPTSSTRLRYRPWGGLWKSSTSRATRERRR